MSSRYRLTETSRSALNKGTARGFTLIEVLIATVVLTVGLLGAASLIALTLAGTARSKYMSIPRSPS